MNLVGISVTNGFDISSDVPELRTWTRLPVTDMEDVQASLIRPATGINCDADLI